MFLGLDTADWTAIGTVGLVLVTTAYVIVTAKLAKSSAQAAAAAKDSARSAERSAAAAERSTRLAEAGLDVDFEVKLEVVEENTPEEWIDVTATGAARVYLHSAVLFGGQVVGDDVKFFGGNLDLLHPTDGLPVSLRKGDSAVFAWPGRHFTPERRNFGVVTLHYGFSAEADALEKTDRSLKFPK